MSFKPSIYFTIFLSLLTQLTFAQYTITGTLSHSARQEIRLEGFNGINTYLIGITQCDEKGNFLLKYSSTDVGMGYLIGNDEKPFILVLSGENINLKGESLAYTQSIKVTDGIDNQLFGRYAQEQPLRDQALSAWNYLEKIYTSDSLFVCQLKSQIAIEQEIKRIHEEEKAFLESIDPKTYLSWFLPIRKLVSNVPDIAQYRTNEIPATIASFRTLDYTDIRLHKSGLLKETLENHFWLLENEGLTLDSMYVDMSISIDYMVKNLITDEIMFNEITKFLFEMLESRSLFEASEYLALKLLNETSCTINSNLAFQLESYRAMKKGNIVPDFSFGNNMLAPGYIGIKPQKLSELHFKNTLIVFGASWCPKCVEELTQIVNYYPKWKMQGVEVIFVSLDDTQVSFKMFANNFPFISICDYQKWDSPVVKDYYVFATPTMFLLNEKREIVLKPNSATHMDSWVDWFLVKGNK